MLSGEHGHWCSCPCLLTETLQPRPFRFDRGGLHNCIEFWSAPAQDWWALYEQGDRVGVTWHTVPWFAGVFALFCTPGLLNFVTKCACLEACRGTALCALYGLLVTASGSVIAMAVDLQ